MSLRDLHTNYILPAPVNRMTAFVPFLVEDFFEDGPNGRQRRYLVSHVFEGFDRPPFGVGVEVLRWNGILIDAAVRLNGDRFAGSNTDARHARGVATLTVRPLMQSLPPDEERVLLDYRTPDGRQHELRVDWLVFAPSPATGAAELSDEVAVAQGVDAELELVQRARKVLYAPDVVDQEQRMARRGRAAATAGAGVTSSMPSVFEARDVSTPSGDFGYVRIRTFGVNDAGNFVAEFIRLVEQLSGDGLILDVRGNGGGLITAGEQLLQTLTPRSIEPTLYQLLNTPLNLQLCERLPFLRDWKESVRQSVRTGATYSRAFPITDPAAANAIGQRYHGPIVLITDALCYSTTDIFAAGFQDHATGVILGVDGNTGAGGANVWTHDLLSRFFPAADPASPYRPLPNGAGLRVSIRRTIRRGGHAGTPVEDLGVVPDIEHEMTRNDLLEQNVDLINRAGELLADMPVRGLDIDSVETSGGDLLVTVTTQNLDRLDIYSDQRPEGSLDVTDGSTEFSLPAGSTRVLELRGFDDRQLVAGRKRVVRIGG